MRTILLGVIFFAACEQKVVLDAQLQAENIKLRSDNAELMAENRKLQLAAHGAPEARTDAGTDDLPIPNGPLDIAQTAYARGDYKAAMDLARKIPESGRTWRIIGASACYLKDAAAATEARKHLDKDNEKFVKSVCQRQGIKL